MRVEKHLLWGDTQKASFTRYCVDNTPEIETGRRYPALVLCGGGGYLRVSQREKEPVALFFVNQGYQVFVLDYSTKSTGNARFPEPVFDLAQTLRTIRTHAEEWFVYPDKIAVMGFSLGGHLCASLATQWNEPYMARRMGGDARELRPDAAVLCYPLLDFAYQFAALESDPNKHAVSPSKGMKKTDYMEVVCDSVFGKKPGEQELLQASPIHSVGSGTPPTFLWHTAGDELVYVGQSLLYAQRLNDCKVPYELHIFEQGPHGLALADRRTTGNPSLIQPDTARWTALCCAFLERHLG